MKNKKLCSILLAGATTISCMSFTAFAAEAQNIDAIPSYINNVSTEKSQVLVVTDEYTITWIPAEQSHPSTFANSKYTIKSWKPAPGSIAKGRLFDITANNTVYIDYDIDWTPSGNVSIGTYSKSGGFVSAITNSGSSSYGQLKIETNSKPVTLAFAVKNNGKQTVTINGYYKI